MSKILAIATQKGGVGKTTTAINLAACLAMADKKTLLIDLDPQGNASVGVGLNKEQFFEKNIYHALIGEASINDVVFNTDLPNFDICPADNNLSGAEIELVSVMARESKLKDALAELETHYDYIIIDCQPSVGLLPINAFNAAHGIIIPLQTEYFAMEGLAQLLNIIKMVQGSLNPDLIIEGILLTMFDKRTSLHKQVASEVKEHFKELVYETIIPRNVRLSECPSFGQPIILYDIESKGSEAYINLAKEFLIRERARQDMQKDMQKNSEEGMLDEILNSGVILEEKMAKIEHQPTF